MKNYVFYINFSFWNAYNNSAKSWSNCGRFCNENFCFHTLFWIKMWKKFDQFLAELLKAFQKKQTKKCKKRNFSRICISWIASWKNYKKISEHFYAHFYFCIRILLHYRNVCKNVNVKYIIDLNFEYLNFWNKFFYGERDEWIHKYFIHINRYIFQLLIFNI